jgi:hypothetical protein
MIDGLVCREQFIGDEVCCIVKKVVVSHDICIFIKDVI